MKLDARDLRYVSTDEFKVLSAVETGSRNHEVVPTPLIAEISGVRGGNVNKALGELAKRNLVARVQNAKYDGYRLTYGGLDWLALRAFSKRKPSTVAAVGTRIGVGKEADVYMVQDDDNGNRILKLERLGRISFRAIKTKRDYLGKRKSASWMYMSRLAAQKEFAFMKVLYENGYPVPVPIDQVRHGIVMSWIDSFPLRQIDSVESPSDLYATLMEFIVRLAKDGLIHGDFNEFNILIRRKDGQPVIIDFPQMVSTRHANAEFFFNRDVNCIRKFFRKRFRYEAMSWPTWKDVLTIDEEDEEDEAAEGAETKETGKETKVQFEETEEEERSAPKTGRRLDLEVEASGFGREMQRELEDYMLEVQDMPQSDQEDDDEDDDEEEDKEDEEEEVEEQAEDDASKEPEEFDEGKTQKEISDRMEAVRLNKALGNDSDDAELDYDTESSSESEESDSDADSDDSVGPAPTEFSSFDQNRKNRRPAAAPKAKGLTRADELKLTVAQQVGKERDQTAKKHHSKKSVNKAGNAKGHKWKQSEAFQVGKNSGW